MEKGVHLDNIYKEVIKPSDFVSVQIRYLSSRQEGKISSKLNRNTLTYIVNTGILRTTKKSLTSTLKTLDCERKHPSKKDSEQIDKNEYSINKQLTEIYHNKHKIYLQSKNLERNRNQTNNE